MKLWLPSEKISSWMNISSGIKARRKRIKPVRRRAMDRIQTRARRRINLPKVMAITRKSTQPERTGGSLEKDQRTDAGGYRNCFQKMGRPKRRTSPGSKPGEPGEIQLRVFLQRFSVLGEVMRVNDEEYELIFYTYGLSLYKNLPLIEPLEYKEVKRIKEFVIAH